MVRASKARTALVERRRDSVQDRRDFDVAKVEDMMDSSSCSPPETTFSFSVTTKEVFASCCSFSLS